MNNGSGPAAKVVAHAGAGAVAAAVGASVADANINNTVTAALGGTVVLTGAATVTSSDTSSARADAFGATVAGGLALGVSAALTNKTSVVGSSFLAGSSRAPRPFAADSPAGREVSYHGQHLRRRPAMGR